jgi:hypothetical protein
MAVLLNPRIDGLRDKAVTVGVVVTLPGAGVVEAFGETSVLFEEPEEGLLEADEADALFLAKR